MDKEDKSAEETKEEKLPLWKKLSLFFKRLFKRKEEPFPPKLKWWEWVILWLSYVVALFLLIYLIEQLCLIRVFSGFEKNCSFLKEILCPCVCCTYIAFGIVLVVLIIDRVVRHKLCVHKKQRVDPSTVDAMIVEANTVEPRLGKLEEKKGSSEIDNKNVKPDNFLKKKEDLNEEVKRLKNLGNLGWTEYQVLSLDQMLVDFLKVDDLITNARLRLAQLKDYADGSSFPYEWEQYCRWDQRINLAIDEIARATEENTKITTGDQSPSEDGANKKDEAAEKLRAELRTLLEHIADYNQSWDEGSAIVGSIRICGVLGLFLLLLMGLLPILHPEGSKALGIFNWGLLGISGAITAVLLSLRKSDLVEVGNTEGKKELWRAVLGTGLGLVAGILVYSMIAGGILSGTMFPAVTFFEQQESKDLALSVFWAIASGYSFEWVFDRLRSAMEGRS